MKIYVRLARLDCFVDAVAVRDQAVNARLDRVHPLRLISSHPTPPHLHSLHILLQTPGSTC